MDERFSRSALIFGEEGIDLLAQKTVAVFGLGGVGGNACEALVRAGIGKVLLIDSDTVSPSNLNRQVIALESTVGKFKTTVMAKRLQDINPDVVIDEYPMFYLPENAAEFDLSTFDYIVDAVDTVAAKIELAVRASAAGVPIISCMGAGNKLDPTRFTVTDIFSTSGDPLARVMRARLRKAGVTALKVVCSEEPPTPLHPNFALSDLEAEQGVRRAPGSLSFVPSVAGLIAAAEVVRDLLGIKR